MMKDHELLDHLHQLVKEKGLDSSIEQTKLLLFLGHDQLNRERILVITAQDQVMGTDPFLVRVQFALQIPLEFKDIAAKDVASLLAFINRLLDLPGFELDEVNSQVYYRYVLLASNTEVNETLYLGIIGMIQLLAELYSSTIEKVSDGSSTFDDVLEEMLKATEEAKG